MKTQNVAGLLRLDRKVIKKLFFDYCDGQSSAGISPNDRSELTLDTLICHYGSPSCASDEAKLLLRNALTETLKDILDLPIRSSARMLKNFISLHKLFPVQFAEGTLFILFGKILYKNAPPEKRLAVLYAELILTQDTVPLEFWRSVDFKTNPDLWVFYLEMTAKNKPQAIPAIIAGAPEGMSKTSKQRIVSTLETIEAGKDSLFLSAPAWLTEMMRHEEVA